MKLGEKERVELFAVGLSFILALVKGGTALWTGTLALFASSLDSLFDFFVSGVNLLAIRVAQKGADEDHAYGHEKAEALAALFQSLFILLSVGSLVYSSVSRLKNPPPIRHLTGGMIVLVLSVLSSLIIAYRLKQTALRTGSVILKTDALHYSMDLFTQGAILVVFGLMELTHWRLLDPLITIPIVLYVGWQAIRIGKEAVDELMDRETSPETQSRVLEIVRRFRPEVIGIHNFKSRRAAGKRFIQFHVEMKKDLTFERVHDLTETITAEIRRSFEKAQVIIHPDPEGSGEDESDLP